MTQTAKWDTALGRQLYDQGMPLAEIAKACKVSRTAMITYARRRWPERVIDAPPKPAKVRRRPPGSPKKLKPGQRTLPDLSSL